MDTTTTRTPTYLRSVVNLNPGTPEYPQAAATWQLLRNTGGLFNAEKATAGPILAALGQPEILQRQTIGLLCSVRCPGNLILMTYEFAKKTSRDGAAIIGGFHSPMERTCLDTLLARHVPVVYCPARRLNPRGIPRLWDGALAEGRLLVISPFLDSQRHVTRDLAHQRNLLIAALANTLLVPYAVRGGKTEAVVRLSVHHGKTVLTFDDPETEHLVGLGASGTTLPALLAGGHDQYGNAANLSA
jgi:predicted Rossmann fold nucleotide-binding protein DprA/Smf involved in DNA uptake